MSSDREAGFSRDPNRQIGMFLGRLKRQRNGDGGESGQQTLFFSGI